MTIQSFMVLFAMPVVISAATMLFLDRSIGTNIFNSAEGGDPLLWQHLFLVLLAHGPAQLHRCAGYGRAGQVRDRSAEIAGRHLRRGQAHAERHRLEQPNHGQIPPAFLTRFCAARDKATSTSLRSLTVLNVLFKYVSAR
jgi:hypothetical protein